MHICNGDRQYEVGKLVAENDNYRLYLCDFYVNPEDAEQSRECLLQIAPGLEDNGRLEFFAYILSELNRLAAEVEERYSLLKKNSDDFLNYDLSFPSLIDSFCCPEQGGRRINILAFKNVERIASMVPLANLIDIDRVRIDLKTSAWIMGKLLKVLDFAHRNSFSVARISTNNILIEPDSHYVLIFDWSEAILHPNRVPADVRREEISLAAQAVISVLTDHSTNCVPDDGHESFSAYMNHLNRLAAGNDSDAGRAHGNFYRLIDSFWERQYHPFTAIPYSK